MSLQVIMLTMLCVYMVNFVVCLLLYRKTMENLAKKGELSNTYIIIKAIINCSLGPYSTYYAVKCWRARRKRERLEDMFAAFRRHPDEAVTLIKRVFAETAAKLEKKRIKDA